MVNRNVSIPFRCLQPVSSTPKHYMTFTTQKHKNKLSIQKLCFQTKDILRAHKFSFTRDSTYLVIQVCQQFWTTDSRLKLKREVADTLKWQSNPSEHFCGKTPGQSPSERSQNFLFCLRFLACTLFYSDRVDMDTTCPPCVAVLCWDDSIVSSKPLAERTVLSIILVPPRTFHWSF